MSELVRHQFQHFAKQYIGQPEFSGYHSTGGVWVYNHNFINMNWKMWQECQKLNDERLVDAISEKEADLRAEYTGGFITPYNDKTTRLRQQIEIALKALQGIKDGYDYPMLLSQQALAQIRELEK